MESILAIDLGGNSAKCAIIEGDAIQYRFVIDTPKQDIIENLYQESSKYLNEFNLNWKQIRAISLSVPGAYNKQTGEIIYAANLGWWNYPILTASKKIFNNENVFVLNDANAAAYGEWRKGQNQEIESMLLYTIGTGIGHGIILNKQLWEGTNKNLASEGGHGGGFSGEDTLCTCGTYGCLEVTSSATGIERELNKTTNKTYIQNRLSKSFDFIKIIDIKDLFTQNDPVIIKIFAECLTPLAKAIGYTHTILDVNKVVIGGGPSQLGDKICEIIFNNAKKYTQQTFMESLNLEIAKLQNDAGIWGAYYWAIDN